MEDDIGTIREQLSGHPVLRQIGAAHVDAERRGFRPVRLHEVRQRELRDRRAGERAVARESSGELAPEHPRGADDQDAHHADTSAALLPSTRQRFSPYRR